MSRDSHQSAISELHNLYAPVPPNRPHPHAASAKVLHDLFDDKGSLEGMRLGPEDIKPGDRYLNAPEITAAIVNLLPPNISYVNASAVLVRLHDDPKSVTPLAAGKKLLQPHALGMGKPNILRYVLPPFFVNLKKETNPLLADFLASDNKFEQNLIARLPEEKEADVDAGFATLTAMRSLTKPEITAAFKQIGMEKKATSADVDRFFGFQQYHGRIINGLPHHPLTREFLHPAPPAPADPDTLLIKKYLSSLADDAAVVTFINGLLDGKKTQSEIDHILKPALNVPGPSRLGTLIFAENQLRRIFTALAADPAQAKLHAILSAPANRSAIITAIINNARTPQAVDTLLTDLRDASLATLTTAPPAPADNPLRRLGITIGAAAGPGVITAVTAAELFGENQFVRFVNDRLKDMPALKDLLLDPHATVVRNLLITHLSDPANVIPDLKQLAPVVNPAAAFMPMVHFYGLIGLENAPAPPSTARDIVVRLFVRNVAMPLAFLDAAFQNLFTPVAITNIRGQARWARYLETAPAPGQPSNRDTLNSPSYQGIKDILETEAVRNLIGAHLGTAKAGVIPAGEFPYHDDYAPHLFTTLQTALATRAGAGALDLTTVTAANVQTLLGNQLAIHPNNLAAITLGQARYLVFMARLQEKNIPTLARIFANPAIKDKLITHWNRTAPGGNDLVERLIQELEYCTRNSAGQKNAANVINLFLLTAGATFNTEFQDKNFLTSMYDDLFAEIQFNRINNAAPAGLRPEFKAALPDIKHKLIPLFKGSNPKASVTASADVDYQIHKLQHLESAAAAQDMLREATKPPVVLTAAEVVLAERLTRENRIQAKHEHYLNMIESPLLRQKLIARGDHFGGSITSDYEREVIWEIGYLNKNMRNMDDLSAGSINVMLSALQSALIRLGVQPKIRGAQPGNIALRDDRANVAAANALPTDTLVIDSDEFIAAQLRVNRWYKYLANNPDRINENSPDAPRPAILPAGHSASEYETAAQNIVLRDNLLAKGLALNTAAPNFNAQMEKVRNFDYRTSSAADFILLVKPLLAQDANNNVSHDIGVSKDIDDTLTKIYHQVRAPYLGAQSTFNIEALKQGALDEVKHFDERDYKDVYTNLLKSTLSSVKGADKNPLKQPNIAAAEKIYVDLGGKIKEKLNKLKKLRDDLKSFVDIFKEVICEHADDTKAKIALKFGLKPESAPNAADNDQDKIDELTNMALLSVRRELDGSITILPGPNSYGDALQQAEGLLAHFESLDAILEDIHTEVQKAQVAMTASKGAVPVQQTVYASGASDEVEEGTWDPQRDNILDIVRAKHNLNAPTPAAVAATVAARAGTVSSAKEVKALGDHSYLVSRFAPLLEDKHDQAILVTTNRTIQSVKQADCMNISKLLAAPIPARGAPPGTTRAGALTNDPKFAEFCDLVPPAQDHAPVAGPKNPLGETLEQFIERGLDFIQRHGHNPADPKIWESFLSKENAAGRCRLSYQQLDNQLLAKLPFASIFGTASRQEKLAKLIVQNYKKSTEWTCRWDPGLRDSIANKMSHTGFQYPATAFSMYALNFLAELVSKSGSRVIDLDKIDDPHTAAAIMIWASMFNISVRMNGKFAAQANALLPSSPEEFQRYVQNYKDMITFIARPAAGGGLANVRDRYEDPTIRDNLLALQAAVTSLPDNSPAKSFVGQLHIPQNLEAKADAVSEHLQKRR